MPENETDAEVYADLVVLTIEQKIDFLYQVALKADKLMKEIAPQVGPILESVSKNPMLKMFLK